MAGGARPVLGFSSLSWGDLEHGGTSALTGAAERSGWGHLDEAIVILGVARALNDGSTSIESMVAAQTRE